MSTGITALYRLGPVSIGTAAAPTVIGGITDLGLTGGIQVIKENVSGEIGIRTPAISAVQPTGRFTTHDIAAALGVCGSLGLSLFLPATPSDQKLLKLYATKLDQDGTIASGAVHRLWTCRGGLLYPSRLTCEHRGQASLQYDALLCSDGANDPWAASDSALPTAAAHAMWTLEAASIASLGATDMQGVDIDFGIQVSGEGANSELYDSQVVIDRITPVVTIRLNDASGDLGLEGEEEAAGTVTFRKRDKNGAYTADQCILGFAGLAHETTIWQAGQRGAGTKAIQVDVEWDGTSTPFTVGSGA
jgi:hypothetical protein